MMVTVCGSPSKHFATLSACKSQLEPTPTTITTSTTTTMDNQATTTTQVTSTTTTCNNCDDQSCQDMCTGIFGPGVRNCMCGGCTCRFCSIGMTFSGAEGTCVDINECETLEIDCWITDDECINLPGSYLCTCPDGYARNEVTGESY